MKTCAFQSFTRAIRDDDRHQLIDDFDVDAASEGQVEARLISRDEAIELGEVDEDPDPTAARLAINSLAARLGFSDPGTVPESIVLRCILHRLDRADAHRERAMRMRGTLDEVEEALAGGDIDRATGILAERRATADDRLGRAFLRLAVSDPAKSGPTKQRVAAALFGAEAR